MPCFSRAGSRGTTLNKMAGLALAAGGLLSACAGPQAASGSGVLQAGASSARTQAAQQAVRDALPADEAQDRQDAERGLIARPTGRIVAADGRVLKDFDAYGFVLGTAPDTVNPSLWRHAQLNAQAGLFKVVDGIYQLRGFDMANITLVEGKTGWIVVDALTNREIAAYAMQFARQHLGNKLVTALIFTHSHADHFGGALGVVSKAEVAQRRIPVVAPAGFMEEATSENLLVGGAMSRRAIYQFGTRLPLSPTGNVDTGLGKDLVSGHVGILPPNVTIDKPQQELVLDGVRFVFYNVPGAEAPSELTFTIPERKAYGGAENLAQTMHNLLPIRGAKVRDALRWADYLQQALEQARGSEVYFGQHNWPVWGQQRIASFISRHRDIYKYTHDQTVRLINQGLVPSEIAEQIRLPASLSDFWGGRGYYGDLRHNVKAVYQLYLGAYDGNPVNLDPLPPRQRAQRYVQALGGTDKALDLARQAVAGGDYRWATELLQHVVFATPDNTATDREARELMARCYEQLGFAAESATWRNSYLTAAQELRQGTPQLSQDRAAMAEMMAQVPTERFLEVLATRLDGAKAEGQRFAMNLDLSDVGEQYRLWLENSVLHFRRGGPDAKAQVSLRLTRPAFLGLLAGAKPGTQGGSGEKGQPAVQVQGDKAALAGFLQLFDKGGPSFPIVTR